MSSRNERFEYRLAIPEDSTAILDLYESEGFSGNISVLYTRRPDPIQSLKQEGDEVIVSVMVDREQNRICAVGCCVIRNAYLNGVVKRTGYLTGLKVHPDYRRRVPHIARSYDRMYELTKDLVDFYYTTILKENVTARKMLEKKRKGMPDYQPRGTYTVYCFRTGVKRDKPSKYRFEKGKAADVRAFYEEQLRLNNLSPDSAETGPAGSAFYILRDEHGEIAAACSLWNQQEVKQYIITGYSGIYRVLKHLPLNILGYPNLPKEQVPANYACVSMLCVKEQDPAAAEVLIGKVSEQATAFDFLMAGVFEYQPLHKAFSNIRHIKYESILYTVQWPDHHAILLDGRPIQLEVGLL